ncbi:MAG: hypothetical protein NOOUEUKL_001026 [Candidatus Fervidibacter sp.]
MNSNCSPKPTNYQRRNCCHRHLSFLSSMQDVRDHVPTSGRRQNLVLSWVKALRFSVKVVRVALKVCQNRIVNANAMSPTKPMVDVGTAKQVTKTVDKRCRKFVRQSGR